MMPSVVGDQPTRWRSLGYTALLVPVTLVPVALGDLSLAYGLAALVLGGWFLVLVGRSIALRRPPVDARVFRGSIAYLGLLFVAMIADLVLVG